MHGLNRTHRPGFTLIEILVVVALVSLLSAAAALTVRQPLGKAKRDLAVANMRSLDRLARTRSIRGQRVQVVFDTVTGTAKLIGDNGSRLAPPVNLNVGSRAFRLLMWENASGGRSGEDKVGGTFVGYGPFGTSPSFAVQVGADEDPWLLVLGMTGQCYTFNAEEKVRAILENERRHDTD